ncbi:MAG: prepilin-type N-terminal cleavage/methylation domain-containing protein [Patescibacteria group bacterium]
MKLLKSKILNLKSRPGFTLIELLVVITIIGILITLTTVAIVPVQRKSRDARRKADVNSFLAAANLFKADFKIYPNSTFYLGSYGGSDAEFLASGVRNPNSNYALAGDIEKCNGATLGKTADFLNLNNQEVTMTGDPPIPAPTVKDMDTKPLLMKPGFVSVNNFLICFRYIDRVLSDPKPFSSEGVDQYQYRVSYDYGDLLIAARLENEATDVDATLMFNVTAGDPSPATYKRYYKGSGIVVRHLDDSSDTTSFFNNLTGSGDAPLYNNYDGKYLYQCKIDNLDATITRDNRVTVEPIVSGAGGYVAGACQNDVGGLDVIPSN